MQSSLATRSISPRDSSIKNHQSNSGSVLDFVVKCQRQVTLSELLEVYEESLQTILKVSGIKYRFPLLNICHTIGDTNTPNCTFQLKVDEEFWGEITIYREHSITESEMNSIELISSLLIHPLRTSIHQNLDTFGDDDMAVESVQLVEHLVTREAKLSHRENVPMSIILFDIDRFKHISNTGNFIYRDEILYKVMKIMRSCTRDTDLLFRYREDTYCLILKGVHINNAHSISERVRIAIDSYPFKDDADKAKHLTVSAGIAGLTQSDSIETIFSRVTHAVQHAKKIGRNQSIIADGRFIN